MRRKLRNLLRRSDEDGQGLVEYGLILALVTLMAIATLNAPGAKMNKIIQDVADSLSTVS